LEKVQVEEAGSITDTSTIQMEVARREKNEKQVGGFTRNQTPVMGREGGGGAKRFKRVAAFARQKEKERHGERRMGG